MKNLILILLSFSFLGFLTGCQKARNKYFDTKISGKVFDFYTRKPLANATVVFGKIQESDFYHAYDSATTDEQGNYEIKSEEKYLEEGWNSVYIVSAKKEGYEVTFADKAFDEFDGFYKKVEGSRNNKNVNLYLRKELKVEVTFNDQFPYIDFSNNNYYYCYLAREENSHYFLQYPGWHKTLNSDYNSGLQVKFLTNLDKISFTIPISEVFLVVDLITGSNPPIFLFSQKIDPSKTLNNIEIVL
jgi:hypothetical protein